MQIEKHFLRFLTLTVLLGFSVGLRSTKRHRFTVADDIALSHFGDLYSDKVDPITFSRNRQYFVVDSERGLLDLNQPESTLRIYRTEDIRHHLLQLGENSEPPPIWKFSISTYRNGPIITQIRWLSDSTGLAFLAKSESGGDQLFLADIKKRTIDALTPGDQNVVAFDIQDRAHFAYAIRSPEITQQAIASAHASSIVGTGHDLFTLLFPDNNLHDLSELWAMQNGRRFRVAARGTGAPIHLYREGLKGLKISPDGGSVVTALAVKDVPVAWEYLYPPPTTPSAYHIRAGVQDLDSFDGSNYVSQYARIELLSGIITTITNAPIGQEAGWVTGSVSSVWSPNGSAVLLVNTFVSDTSLSDDRKGNRPCIALVELRTRRANCVEYLTKDGDEEYHYIESAQFLGSDNHITVHYRDMLDWSHTSNSTLVYSNFGMWSKSIGSSNRSEPEWSIKIEVKQSFKEPPVLVATDEANKMSRVILDPNPQLKEIEFGETSLFKWKDPSGQTFTGALFKPRDFVIGKRYPLVIQTHGFTEGEFRPFGSFPTADAAQELASAGIMVLQAPGCQLSVTPDEGPCNVRQYESAIQQLVDDGMVDADHIGIAGFSRTCYYVLSALTTSKWRFKAASITDGVNEGYLQYLVMVDFNGNVIPHEADAMIGARPFGQGLEEWLKHSPGFNMDKVTTPLLVVALGKQNVLFMWEPYATLRHLNKQVDLVFLNTSEHVLTNPVARMISQGGTVDWFRFWLQGYEDSDPAKAKQYGRWLDLRKLQEQNQGASVQPSSSSYQHNR
jgi:hypothetical protein